MNDFDKEELIMLKRLARQHVNQFRENSDCIELMDKIQMMIDNYCEHKNGIGINEWKTCNDCGQPFP